MEKLYICSMRKYYKTTGYWVYAHVMSNKDVYIGMSKQQPCKRWNKSLYKGLSLEPYIEKYGWENIEHRVLIDGLTKKEAEQVEDWFIRKATADGFCINKHRSGGIERDDYKAYNKQYWKQYYEDHKKERKQYREEHKEEHKQYREEHKEEKRIYDKQRYSTPEGKIYNRVHNYNRNHPNETIETPAEAKQKYLKTGYIPNYIKHDDLV